MLAIAEIELNLDNNDIASLPNSAMRGFELITIISAKNNSIKSISVHNLPVKLKELDLSGNQLESLTTPVIQQLSSMKMLKRLVLGGNSWTCDDQFFDFIRFNKEKVDYEQILCNDEEPLFQKHNRLTFWITNETRSGVRPPYTDSDAIIRKLSHAEDLDKFCHPECDCVVEELNTTVKFKFLSNGKY